MIAEYSEDIYPYATFHLPEHDNMGGNPQRRGTFLGYHDEGLGLGLEEDHYQHIRMPGLPGLAGLAGLPGLPPAGVGAGGRARSRSRSRSRANSRGGGKRSDSDDSDTGSDSDHGASKNTAPT